MKAHKSYILALDPGTNMTGVALFEGKKLREAFTVKKPVKSKDSDVRAYHIIREVEDRLRQYISCKQCDECHVTLVYEDPQYQRRRFGGVNIEPVYRMAGMLTFWGMACGMEVCRYKVSDIKFGVSGSRNASKEVVEGVVRAALHINGADHSDHAYDAMSVGLYHLNLHEPGSFALKLPVS